MTNKLKYNNTDIQNIKIALKNGHKFWDNKLLNNVKRKIKKYTKRKNNDRCAYCGRYINGEFNLVIDIEHILPKSHPDFLKFMFTPKNLAISCKACNMLEKGTKIDFLTVPTSTKKIFNSSYYQFIHPSLDKYDDHLRLLTYSDGDERLFKYSKRTDKGRYTYEYFNLTKFEIDTFNKSQGIEDGQPSINNEIARLMHKKLSNENGL
ncbi:HNH endonuclease [Aliarcobacter butzleri]|uniref:HNH endonuclease n=1 Tax=Aliarcobacter butzleri TaxID=28197 RepID=UPI0021B19815|nr:HNH endonuclease [Aliarcobacter butzleri]MCT7549079.1 HNH endonuclease [Aliarcobacter butzleri]MCT7558389.1 HNH endonuclease [Aliarcobacter butzleri]